MSHLSLPARSTVLWQGPTTYKEGKGHYTFTERGRGRGGGRVQKVVKCIYEKGGHVPEKGKEGGHAWRGRNDEDKYREEGI